MALNMYESDHGLYPLDDPLVQSLDIAGSLGESGKFKCPLDSSAQADTYSYGYLGGHPRSIQDNDPLVVCGWHGRTGILANFSDSSVDELAKREGHKSLPVTATFGDQSAQPGFVLHNATPLVLTATNGYSASITGAGGVTYIGASYDPFGNNGNGSFDVVLDFPSNISGSSAWGTPANYVNFRTKFQYTTVTVTGNQNSLSTQLQWFIGNPNLIVVSNYKAYRITNRYSGHYLEDSTAPGTGIFLATKNSLEKVLEIGIIL